MALDGIFLSRLAWEISAIGLGARVDKISQPSREELIIALRGQGETRRLLICTGAGSPRLHFTQTKIENPMAPPMFCMLLRKHLAGARLSAVTQIGLDRILHISFDTTNELGDPVTLILAVEIMGRHSNCILIGADGRVIDSIKRIGLEMSSVRPILPGITYTLPPMQEKLNLQTASVEQVLEALLQGKDFPISKALLGVIEGASPLVCRELAPTDAVVSALTPPLLEVLSARLQSLKEIVSGGESIPTAVYHPSKKPMDFSFMPILQYGDAASVKSFESCSALLDEFYSSRDLMARMSTRSHDLQRFLMSAIERTQRKLAAQRIELAQCADREQIKIMGDLISANIYSIQKGQDTASVENFYAEGSPLIQIPLDIMLTPSQNMQKYYAEYRKSATAEDKLTELIVQGEQEGEYLESVYDSLIRAVTNAEIDQIRMELAEGKYLRKKGSGKDKPIKLAPKQYLSDDGFTILVGRNNTQNDRLTLKDSKGSDMWLHSKNVPGSHVIVVSDGREIPDSTITQAAVIAAVCSKGRDSGGINVDYTPVKYVKKPQGGKPGMVIYHVYKTAYVTPDPELEARLRKA